MKPKISVIIPAYNRAETLQRAIDSVIAQNYNPWELVLVDDGSTDETNAIMQKVLAGWTREQNIKVLRQENLGVSAARNLGVKNSRGEWLAFLDSDDEWLPEKLALQIRVADFSTLPLVHGEEVWLRNGVRVNPKVKYKKSGGEIFDRCVETTCISTSTTIMRRDLFDSLGGFREDFKVCEDYELWLRITAKTPVGFVDTPVANKYGGHSDQLSTQFHSMDYYRVKALVPFFATKPYAAEVAAQKCDILIKGYEKHTDPKSATQEAEVREWLKLARA